MPKKVLIVGASGLVGTAAANSFARAGWQVIAASRRRPDLLIHENIEFLALDLQDADACIQACRGAQRYYAHCVHRCLRVTRLGGTAGPTRIK